MAQLLISYDSERIQDAHAHAHTEKRTKTKRKQRRHKEETKIGRPAGRPAGRPVRRKDGRAARPTIKTRRRQDEDTTKT